MSRALDALRSQVCDADGCWATGDLTDAGVTVRLGSGWHCLRADQHFSNVRGCCPSRVGGYCDGIAVHEQQSSRVVRFLELKRSVDFSAAKRQLAKGVELVDSQKCQNPGRYELSAEHHVPAAPRISVRPTRPMKVNGRFVPIKLVVAGQEYFAA